MGAASKVEDFVAYWAAQYALNWKIPVTRQKFLSVTGNPVRQMLRLALEGRITVSQNPKVLPIFSEKFAHN